MGKLVALCQWRPTEGRKRKKRDRVSRCVCVCVVGRHNLIRSKTNGGKDWVKEQEELRVQMREQKTVETWKREVMRWKKTAECSGRGEDEKIEPVRCVASKTARKCSTERCDDRLWPPESADKSTTVYFSTEEFPARYMFRGPNFFKKLI